MAEVGAESIVETSVVGMAETGTVSVVREMAVGIAMSAETPGSSKDSTIRRNRHAK